jgi:hypothetical protein
MKPTGLFVIELSDATLPFDTSGTMQAYRQRKPTPAEIKAAHPKCGSCDYAVKPDPRGMTFCGNQSTILTGYAVNPTTHYCPHHQPKEQQ